MGPKMANLRSFIMFFFAGIVVEFGRAGLLLPLEKYRPQLGSSYLVS